MIIKNKKNFIDGSVLCLIEMMVDNYGILEFTKIYDFFYHNKKNFDLDFFNIFKDIRISREKKKNYFNVFLNLLPNYELLKNYFKILYKNNVFYLSSEIIYFFCKNAKSRINMIEGTIKTPMPLSNYQLLKIKKFFIKRLKNENVRFHVVVDKTIKYGIILSICDKTYDFSLDGRIQKLRKSLFQ